MAEPTLQLINLEGGGTFTFRFFPHTTTLDDCANWEPQDLTHGQKSLFYANREPRKVTFPELFLDSTETNQSLRPQLDALVALMNEISGLGRPPKLLAVWGDGRETSVLKDTSIKETLYNRDGQPIRAEIAITLLRIQPDA